MMPTFLNAGGLIRATPENGAEPGNDILGYHPSTTIDGGCGFDMSAHR
jgi:hypothetical protein